VKQRILILMSILFITAITDQAAAQTKCIWVVKSNNSKELQKIGISLSLAKLLAEMDGDFNINGVKLKYKTLMQAYRSGSVMRIKDNTGNGETKVYGGKFDQEMKESSEKNNRLIIENSENGGEPTVSKLRVKSIQSLAMLFAMIGSIDLDDDMEKIESTLEQGGVLYVHDFKKDSLLWMYVN
jgi:hypothetical protein